jgi:flagellar basal body-associated protein FliL
MEDASMSVPGSAAKPNTETKQKIESKPVVENKPPVGNKGKSRKFWILIGFVILVVLAASTSFLTLPHFKGARIALGTKLGINGDTHKEKVKATLTLDPFLVNLADTDEIRFVKTTFQLGLAENPTEMSKTSVTTAAIRDAIISLLTSKKADQVLTPQGKEELRREILSRVNTIAPDIKVLQVYIVDFVVQL